MVDKLAKNVDNSAKMCKSPGLAKDALKSYPHSDSEKSMNITYPHKMWISYPHYPHPVDNHRYRYLHISLIHTKCG